MQSLDAVINHFNKTKEIPAFKAGDKVVVKSRIKEGDKERVQAFEGVVIARKGSGAHATFTVRKVSSGIGVERIYPLNSPNIVSIERKMEGYVRRSKLYYIRDLDGKAARIQDKNIRLMESQGGVATDEQKAASKAAKAAAKAAKAPKTEEA